jgi:CRP/FNR family cyclic AMP-dependent transcriptional regulator
VLVSSPTLNREYDDVPGHVATALVRIAGNSVEPMVTIELTRRQLADMAGGPLRDVNYAIGAFAIHGWLRAEGRRIVITNLAALRRRAGLPDR